LTFIQHPVNKLCWPNTAQNKVMLKNMETGEQQLIDINTIQQQFKAERKG